MTRISSKEKLISYQDLKALVEIGNLEDTLLELLYHLLLRLCTLFCNIGYVANLLGSSLVLSVQLGVVLCQLAESLARGRFNLERLDFL